MSEITQTTARALLGAARALLRELDRRCWTAGANYKLINDAINEARRPVTQAETELNRKDEPEPALTVTVCDTCGTPLAEEADDHHEQGHTVRGADYCGPCFDEARAADQQKRGHGQTPRGLLQIQVRTWYVGAHWNETAAYNIPAAWVAAVVVAPAAYTGPRHVRGHTRDSARALLVDEAGSRWQIRFLD